MSSDNLWSKHSFLLVIMTLLLCFHIKAQSTPKEIVLAEHAPLNRPLRVGVVPAPPFAFKKGDIFKGIAIDFWELIAEKHRWTYEYVLTSENIEHVIDHIAKGDLDLAIGDISTTRSRLEKVDFSRPFFLSHLGIVFSKQRVTPWDHIITLLSFYINPVFMSIFLITIFYMFFFWLGDRHLNEKVPRRFLPGMRAVGWSAIILMIGGGTEVIESKSWLAKLTTTLWLIALLIIATTFLTSFTSELTTELLSNKADVSSLSELQGKKLGAIRGHTGAAVADEFGTPVVVDTVEELLDLVNNRTVNYGIDDTEVLQYLLGHSLKPYNLGVSKLFIKNDEYAIAVNPKIAPQVMRTIDLTLLDLQDGRGATKICYPYITDTRPCNL